METPRTVEAPGWKHALRLWWSFSWRSALWLFALLLPIAIITGVVTALTKPPPEYPLIFSRLIAFPLMCIAQIAAFRQILRIDYKGFSVRAIERRTEGE